MSGLYPHKIVFLDIVKSYILLGVKHIIGGLDHLLFLFALLYIARKPKRILVTITGFTLAHSLTLFLIALDVIHVSIFAVEAVIILSIIFLAREIVLGNRASLTWRKPILVAAGFGLIHGAGFANALSEIGLPQAEKITALLFFNIGVEVGQVLIILFTLTIAKIITFSPKLLRPFRTLPWHNVFGYGIGIVSAHWAMAMLW